MNVEIYDNGNDKRILVTTSSGSHVLTVDQAIELRDALTHAIGDNGKPLTAKQAFAEMARMLKDAEAALRETSEAPPDTDSPTWLSLERKALHERAQRRINATRTKMELSE
jgi:hypothetical protein